MTIIQYLSISSRDAFCFYNCLKTYSGYQISNNYHNDLGMFFIYGRNTAWKVVKEVKYE